jgi:hypothetical protein
MQYKEFYGTIIFLLLFVGGCYFSMSWSSGHLLFLEPKELLPGEIVSCSDYPSMIVDIYKTPSGNYILWSTSIRANPVDDDTFSRAKVGLRYNYGKFINITVLDEKQYGMRDACMVVSP